MQTRPPEDHQRVFRDHPGRRHPAPPRVLDARVLGRGSLSLSDRLALSIALLGLICAGSSLVPVAVGSDAAWIDDDWSGGRYAEVRGIDAEIAPGLLVLDNRLDDLRLVAHPTSFQGMYSIAAFHDTLFITASDYPYMYDGAEVIAYDMAAGTFEVVYRPYESGLHLIKRIGDTLYIPGPDSMDEWWQEGSIYTYDGGAWVEKATLPTAVHVNDVEIVNGLLFATTGHATGELNGFGCVWVSDDWGDTFRRVLTIEPSEAHFWRRFFGAGRHGDRLFVQPDGYPPENEVIYATRDGADWDTIPVPGLPIDKHAMFTPWGDSLLMTINDKLFIWDGDTWHAHTLPFVGWRWCRGFHAYEGKLYGGGDSCRLFRWLGGSDWEPVGDLPVNPDAEEIEAMATCYGRLFISTSRPQQGMAPGLFVSAALPQGTLQSLIHDFGGETRNARLSWDAIAPDSEYRARFQVRWADTPPEIPFRPFVGPDGTALTWFETPDTPLPQGHAGARCYQYLAELRCPDGLQMPFVRRVTLTCEFSDPATVEPSPPIPGEDDYATGPGPDRPTGGTPFPLTIRAASPITSAALIRVEFADPVDRGRSEIDLWIFDARGALIRGTRLRVDGLGRGSWRWDLRDEAGHRVPSGVYRITAGRRDHAPIAAARSLVVLR